MLWPLVADAAWWIELIDHGGAAIIVPIVTLAAPYLALPFLAWFAARRGSRGNHKAIAAIGTEVDTVKQLTLGITGQVSNGHTDPLREDLDRVMTKQDDTEKKIDGLIVSVAEIIGEMRGLTHRVDQLGR